MQVQLSQHTQPVRQQFHMLQPPAAGKYCYIRTSEPAFDITPHKAVPAAHIRFPRQKNVLGLASEGMLLAQYTKVADVAKYPLESSPSDELHNVVLIC